LGFLPKTKFPNPQSPIPNPHNKFNYKLKLILKNNKTKKIILKNNKTKKIILKNNKTKK